MEGKISLENFTPYPKNPIIAKIFVNIGYADSLGSGVRTLYKYTKIYSNAEPDFEEGDVFRLIVPMRPAGAVLTSDRKSDKVTEVVTVFSFCQFGIAGNQEVSTESGCF